MGELARVSDLLALLDREVAVAVWFSDETEQPDDPGPGDMEEGGFAFFAQVSDDDLARERMADLLADPIAAGDLTLSVADGVAIVTTNPDVIEAVRAGDAPGSPTMPASPIRSGGCRATWRPSSISTSGASSPPPWANRSARSSRRATSSVAS